MGYIIKNTISDIIPNVNNVIEPIQTNISTLDDMVNKLSTKINYIDKYNDFNNKIIRKHIWKNGGRRRK